MVTNNQIKEYRSLGQSKFRQKYGKFIVEGHKISTQLLSKTVHKIIHIICTEKWADNNAVLLENRDYSVVDRKTIEKISHLKTPQDILLILEMPSMQNTIQEGNAIYMDDVQDPGNVGTIIRIADWFGIKNVIRSRESADFYNPKVLQATMGAFDNVNMVTYSQEELLNHAIPLVVTDMDGEDINTFSFPENACIVMGNEGNGVGDLLLQNAAHTVSIVGNPSRSAESLNVGIACGIVCSRIKK